MTSGSQNQMLAHTSFRDRNRCAKPEHVLIACNWPGVILEVKKTCAVLYCVFIFQSFSNSCTLLSVGVMKYTPETDSNGSLFFSRFSTTAMDNKPFSTL